ncbi:MAG: nuclear transport factor 2 family protein [Coleofasciculus sp. G1-WW12-02]|uniref:nuclear transport factor 2 family protein n=1 Tax=unclassified Coleofasciculus TaxID=2692782 RepID=UPI0032FE8D66
MSAKVVVPPKGDYSVELKSRIGSKASEYTILSVQLEANFFIKLFPTMPLMHHPVNLFRRVSRSLSVLFTGYRKPLSIPPCPPLKGGLESGFEFSPGCEKSGSLSAKTKAYSLNGSMILFLAVGLTVGWATATKAEDPATAPPQLKELLAQIDAAANRQDVQGVMQFYSQDFKHSDGLTHVQMEEALKQLWERYPQLMYRTELQSWENQGDGMVAETVTTVTGTQPNGGTMIKLESTLRSRQRYENQKIVSSEILAERSQLTSGVNPPNLQVILPEQVRIGQSFNFDVIVQEPLGDNLLLGTALEEPISRDRYSQPSDFELDLLSAGGIFKVGRAPLNPQDRWISAVLIRGDGMTMITRRLNVVDR